MKHQLQPITAGFQPVILRDGRQAGIRPIRADDAPRLQAFFQRLSAESIFFRFLGPHRPLTDQEARELATVDSDEHMALVGIDGCGDDERVIGVARYAPAPGGEPGVVEVAIIVEDDCQRQGLGSMLLAHLLTYAVAHGVTGVQATVHADNEQILRFIRRSTLPTRIERPEPCVLRIDITLAGHLEEAVQALSVGELFYV